ncbi:MAG: DoxX family protein [Hyphomicrobiaceae bacterium]|nr:MAG: DoxX family protein [Hyphomicrobiaceae bacterium]
MGEMLVILGRVMLSSIFIISGVRKAMNIAGTAGYIANVGGLPYADILVYATIALEVIGGIMLLVGFQARIAAFLLGLFTLAAAVFFHKFWAIDAAKEAQKYSGEFNNFLKNISLAGGLLFVAGTSTGGASRGGQAG